MRIEGETVIFKSTWEHYKHELDGSKAYTDRIIPSGREEVKFAAWYHRWQAGEPARIRITCNELTPDNVPASFGRQVSHVLFKGFDILSGQEYIIAWWHSDD